MTTETELLRAVLQDPDDDGPRLAYADWLESKGDPRGKFIRCDLEIAALKRQDPSARVPAKLTSWRGFLLGEHKKAWFAPFRGLADEVQYRRGFVELVTLDAARFLEVGDDIFALAPVRHANLTGTKTVFADLCNSPLLGRLRSLGLSNNQLDDDDVARLAASPNAANLRWLGLSHNEIGMRGWEAIAASPHLKRLRYVGTSANPFAPALAEGIDGVGGSVVATSANQAAHQLEEKHGHLLWLRPSAVVERFLL